jgi:hypothetical protein
MLINSPNISGSLKVTGNTVITGSLTVLGGINATITGSATSASYVEYTNVANKPTLVSGSSQITYSGLSGIPADIVSGSSQISFNGIVDKPTLVSGSSQVTYSGLSGIPSGIVSSSTQITGYNIFATTGSNQFNGSQAITGSLTVTGQVVAQTLNVQQVTSSIVYSSGSNIFGNSLGNTQQFTGSVSVTGSLAVNGAGSFASSMTILDSSANDTTLTIGTNGEVPTIKAGGSNTDLKIEAVGSGGFLQLVTNSNPRVHITPAGNVGIGTTSPASQATGATTGILDVSAATGGNLVLHRTGSGDTALFSILKSTNGTYIDSTGAATAANNAIYFRTNNINADQTSVTTALTISSGGNIGIGTASSGALLRRLNIVPATDVPQLYLVQSNNDAGGWMFRAAVDGHFRIISYQGSESPKLTIRYDTGNVGIGNDAPQSKLQINSPGSTLGLTGDAALRIAGGTFGTDQIVFGYSETGGYSPAVFGYIALTATGYQYGDLFFATRAVTTDTAPTERMRITSEGFLLVGVNSSAGYGSVHRIARATTESNAVLSVDGGSGNDFSTQFRSVAGGNFGTSEAAQWLGRNSSTLRSINAGGTVNASGADYAEYMTKAIEDNIAKGDIVGVNAEGELTNIFADAISFVVKSTDPSYVGGDTWGNSDSIGKLPSSPTEEEKIEYNNKLETARQKVDRIAFSGQVPCNVMGANVGDYIIPIELENGKIGGQAVTTPTFQQYQISVGKVWKIMEDGRAWIAVKIG